MLARYLQATCTICGVARVRVLIFAAGSKSPNLEKPATTLNVISGAPCAPVVRTGDAHEDSGLIASGCCDTYPPTDWQRLARHVLPYNT